LTNARVRKTLSKVQKAKPVLIFANTALTLEYAAQLKEQLNVPLIINMHELDTMFFYCDVNAFGKDMEKIDFFLPASQAVKKLYQSKFGVPDSKTEVVYDFTNDKLNGVSTGAEVRAKFGIPANGRIIGAVGSLGWRKGPDLFLQIAHYLTQSGNDELYFMWVGCNTESIPYKEIEHDVRLMGLGKRVFFIGSQKDVSGFYEAFDVFLLTSREDPFPLVCMEAAMSGCPIMCFADGGGMPEFVRDDAGFVVPYCDTKAMGDKALYLIHNEVERKKMGQVAQQRAVNNHTIRTIGPQVNAVIDKFL
jgi:glycosyltransferase involved in cell wall biosynthesis